MKNQLTQTLRDAVGNSARVFRALGCVALVTLGTAGCYARAGTAVYSEPVVYSETVAYDEPVVVVQSVPVAIESCPRHRYHNSYVYLVDGQWYSRSRGRWVTYRAEPRDLATVRVSYEAKYGRNYRPRNEAASPQRPHQHRRDRR